MGGGPCLIILDGGNAKGAASQLSETLATISDVIQDLDQSLTETERDTAVKLSHDVCEMADKMSHLNNRLTKFYSDVATKHAKT